MMFANQSPIGYSNGYTGGIGNPVPPNPIANIGGCGYNQPMGNYGYNPYMNQQYQQQPITGGYYTNNYYTQNPYLVQRQMELQKMQEEEANRQQASIMKFISRNVNRSLGYEVNDEYLSQYDPVYRDPKEIQCEQHWDRMQRLEQLSQQQQVSTPVTRMNDNNNARIAQMKERYPDDMDLFAFLEVAGELYCEAVAEKGRQQEVQINRLYNQNDFRQLLNLHNTGGSYYSSIMNFNPDDVSIDDMEITLPENLARSYSERKAKFFNAILGG